MKLQKGGNKPQFSMREYDLNATGQYPYGVGVTFKCKYAFVLLSSSAMPMGNYHITYPCLFTLDNGVITTYANYGGWAVLNYNNGNLQIYTVVSQVMYLYMMYV